MNTKNNRNKATVKADVLLSTLHTRNDITVSVSSLHQVPCDREARSGILRPLVLKDIDSRNHVIETSVSQISFPWSNEKIINDCVIVGRDSSDKEFLTIEEQIILN